MKFGALLLIATGILSLISMAGPVTAAAPKSKSPVT
jgi:hypothetical protein